MHTITPFTQYFSSNEQARFCYLPETNNPYMFSVAARQKACETYNEGAKWANALGADFEELPTVREVLDRLSREYSLALDTEPAGACHYMAQDENHRLIVEDGHHFTTIKLWHGDALVEVVHAEGAEHDHY